MFRGLGYGDSPLIELCGRRANPSEQVSRTESTNHSQRGGVMICELIFDQDQMSFLQTEQDLYLENTSCVKVFF